MEAQGFVHQRRRTFYLAPGADTRGAQESSSPALPTPSTTAMLPTLILTCSPTAFPSSASATVSRCAGVPELLPPFLDSRSAPAHRRLVRPLARLSRLPTTASTARRSSRFSSSLRDPPLTWTSSSRESRETLPCVPQLLSADQALNYFHA